MPLLICSRPLLILLLSVAASHGVASGATYDSSMCLSEPYTCGGVSFSYPFYRSSERKEVDGNENSLCGYPGMGIVCDDDKPILQLDGVENYTVKSIDGRRANVSIADPEAVGSCPRVEHNVTFAQASWLAFPDSTVDYLFLFLDCLFRQGLVRPTPLFEITCPDIVARFTGYSFVLPNGSVPAGNWSQSCRLVIQVPVLKFDHPDDPNNSTWRNGGYGHVFRQGFQVSWDNRSAACTQCEDSNGRCGYKQTGEFLGCLCTNGTVADRNCTTYNSAGKHFSTKHPIFSIATESMFFCY
ncbi:hypothetical protein ACQ4PT_025762 [Festuca glaucescens]